MEVVRYWVVPGRLMAGAYPGAPEPLEAQRNLGTLLDAGVRAFVDLTEPGEVTRLGPLRPYAEPLHAAAGERAAAPTYTRFPIRDLDVPTRGLMTSVLDALDAALGAGRPAYVHCLGGRGRTGTVLGCYLVRHAGRLLGAGPGDDPTRLALARIRELRALQAVPLPNASPEMPAQRQFVLSWKEGL